MNRTSIEFGLATFCLVGFTSASFAQTCGGDNCDSCTRGACCKRCDDRGLLDVLNSAASNFEARLAGLIPDRKCHCKSGMCTCSTGNTVHNAESHAHRSTHSTASPIEIRNEIPPQPARPLSHSPVPTPTHSAPADLPPVVRPKVIAPELVPAPDSQVNPFRDDTTSNLKPVPATRASYLKPQRSPSSDFDPQARWQSQTDWSPARHVGMADATSRTLASSTSSRKTALQGSGQSRSTVITAAAVVEAVNPSNYHNSLRDK